MFVELCTGTLCLFVLVRCVNTLRWGRCKYDMALGGKIALITGANSGLGKQLVREMVRRGASVIMACRDMVAAERVAGEIRSQYVNCRIETVHLDLADFASVRDCARHVSAAHPTLDILINNAGVALPADLTAAPTDIEQHLKVNHLGHFLLTGLLLHQLSRADRMHVIVTGSSLYRNALRANFCARETLPQQKSDPVTDLTPGSQTDHTAVDMPMYARSKLCNLLFVEALSRRVRTGQAVSTRVTVNLVTPGWVHTSLFRHQRSLLRRLCALPFALLFMRSVTQGVQTHLACIMQPQSHSYDGYLYANCVPVAHTSTLVPDAAVVADEMWTISERLTGFQLHTVKTRER